MEKEKEDKKIINIDLDEDENENNGNAYVQHDVGASEAEDNVIDKGITANCSTFENSDLQSKSCTLGANCKKNKKIRRAVKDILTSNSTKFMSNFDPELSNREKRKLTRKFNVDGKKSGSIHDENGAVSGLEKEICDCLLEGCPGCHFPCPKCRSCKCGIECRINRKWIYEMIESEADLMVTKNSNTSIS